MTSIDPKGEGHVVWSAYDRSGCRVYYSRTKNSGGSWSRPTVVSGPQGCATFPSVGATDDGVAVGWYGTDRHRGMGSSDRRRRQVGSPLKWARFAVDPYQDEVSLRTTWHVFARLLVPGRGWGPTWKVTERPILQGALGRNLLDFFEIELGDDSRIHMAFASGSDPGGTKTVYARSTRLLSGSRRRE